MPARVAGMHHWRRVRAGVVACATSSAGVRRNKCPRGRAATPAWCRHARWPLTVGTATRSARLRAFGYDCVSILMPRAVGTGLIRETAPGQQAIVRVAPRSARPNPSRSRCRPRSPKPVVHSCDLSSAPGPSTGTFGTAWIGTVESRRAAIAEAVMHVLRDGVDDAVRLRGADQLAIERFRTPVATWADLVRRLQIDAQHSNLAVLDGETIRHNGPFDRKQDQTRERRREARCMRASRRVASGVRCAAGTLGTATRCDR